MTEVYLFIQKELKSRGLLDGAVDGVIGPATEKALNKIPEVGRSGLTRERKAILFLQLFLNEKAKEKGEDRILIADGGFGPLTKESFLRYQGMPAKIPTLGADQFWMPGIEHNPRWNANSCPYYRTAPQGIVLHRTAGHYKTGDFAVGKYGNSKGPAQTGASLGFHFLIGKEPGQIIQFLGIERQISHVKAWAYHYVGIEISGDVGMWNDGYLNGEPLTAWQLETVVKVIRYIQSIYPHIPSVEPANRGRMHVHGEFNGLIGHRDLSRNDHADSPNKADWEKILSALNGATPNPDVSPVVSSGVSEAVDLGTTRSVLRSASPEDVRMREIYLFVQKELTSRGLFAGDLDGDIGDSTVVALDKIPDVKKTKFGPERKAVAFLQIFLNEKAREKGLDRVLVVDGKFGTITENSYRAHTGAAGNVPSLGADQYWMPGITHDPRWNADTRPYFHPKPTGIVLHRTAGYYKTGDYKVGKFGNSNGPAQKGNSLGFHFLIGKEPGEIIQFLGIDRQIAHVKAWADHYVGIEISGDVNMWQDGYLNGEDLTDWQFTTVIQVIRFIQEIYPGIPSIAPTDRSRMHSVSVFNGLVGHRDLSKNDHADSPNKKDWERILAELKRIQDPTAPEV